LVKVNISKFQEKKMGKRLFEITIIADLFLIFCYVSPNEKEIKEVKII
jgi:hypothetical protein